MDKLQFLVLISVEAANLSDWRIESNRKNRFGSENRIKSKLFTRIGMLYCGPGDQEISIDCCTASWPAVSSSSSSGVAARRAAANAGSATSLSADVRS